MATEITYFNTLPVIYQKRLNPVLLEKIKTQLEADPDEQTNVLEELALMRESAGDYIEVYSFASELHMANPTAASQKAKLEAGQLMNQALQKVLEAAERANKIAGKQKDRFNIHDLKHLIESVLILHHDTVGQRFPKAVELFARAVEEQLKLPSKQDRGTDLHPDDTAKEFDDAVPHVIDYMDD